SSGQGAGAAKSLSFTGGTLLGFYLIQNNTTVNAVAGSAKAFFSYDGANTDHFDHTVSTLGGDGSSMFFWEDQTGGGDQDFNDAVFTITVTNGGGVSLTGLPGQTVPATFTLGGTSTAF